MVLSNARQTRSGAVYGPYHWAVETDFPFHDALFKTIALERKADYEDPFLSSPLSSAPSSPRPSTFPLPAADESSPLSSPPSSPRPSNSPLPAADASSPPPSPARLPSPSSYPPPLPSNPILRNFPRVVASPSKRQRQKEKSKARRQSSRKAKQDVLGNPAPVPSQLFSKIVRRSSPVAAESKLETQQVAKGAFLGHKTSFTPRTYLLKQLVGLSSLNFRLVLWDGITPKPILDRSQRIVAVLAGQPRDNGWFQALARATSLMEDVRQRGDFSPESINHSRGRFPTLASGYAHGGGRKQPGSQRPRSLVNAALVDELLVVFERVANFQSHVLAAWQPRIYSYFLKMASTLRRSELGLVQNWPNSVYSSAVWNLGPQTACFKHIDFANLPFGLCAVTALGSFNPTRSGHIILWGLNLVVEFPPGATALVPSAVVPHGNTPVQIDESRYSFTQYCSGGLFRWMERGMQGDRDYFKAMSENDYAASREEDAKRWEFGLSLFTTQEELQQKQRQ
ncbi:hypothetical protein H0H93_013186 [Arthromyces matolae]|nr:hypothetical protein H0H93_013186 [Arthromyces matolae]